MQGSQEAGQISREGVKDDWDYNYKGLRHYGWGGGENGKKAGETSGAEV